MFRFVHNRARNRRFAKLQSRQHRLSLESLENRRLLAISLSTLDDFEDGTTSGWREGGSSPNPPTNVANGGPEGEGDSFLQNVSSVAGAGAAVVMFNTGDQWTGDYAAAGVTRVDAQLANFGTEPLAMRFAVATGPIRSQNRDTWFASTDAVELPADGTWHAVSFALDDTSLTRVQGSDSLATVLGDVTEVRILSRQNSPGFQGDRLATTFGADNIRAAAGNEAPEVVTTSTALEYLENQTATSIDPGLTVSDGDSADLVGATVSITSGLASTEDELGFTDQLGIEGDYDAASGVLTLTGTASVADYETALRSVTYVNASDDPSEAPRIVTFLVDDGEATGSSDRTINVTAENDAPEIVTSASDQNFVQNQGPITVDMDLTISDPDSDNLVGATVSIGEFSMGEDVLGFSDQLGISGSFDDATGILTLAGTASIEDYQTALRSVTYDNTSDSPTATPRSISFQVDDGQDTDTASRLITIESIGFDFGDAGGTYPTTFADDGAAHVATGPRLGELRDTETDGQPSASADGDDATGADDEDGVTLNLVRAGQTNASAVIDVQNASAEARLDAWIDFDGDGTWQASEQIADSVVVTAGENSITFDVPRNVTGEPTIARFRLSTEGNLEPTGSAFDGEVEDYQLEIATVSWHNFDDPFDVNGLNGASPLDALLVINELTDRLFSDPETGVLVVDGRPPPFLDVTNDGIVSPLDALQVINELPSTTVVPIALAAPWESPLTEFPAARRREFHPRPGMFIERLTAWPADLGIQPQPAIVDAALQVLPDSNGRDAEPLGSMEDEDSERDLGIRLRVTSNVR